MKDYFEFQGNIATTGSRNAIHEAFRRGLIEDGDGWMDTIRNRNRSSHTYDEANARHSQKRSRIAMRGCPRRSVITCGSLRILQPTEVLSERFGLPQAAIDRMTGELATFPAIERGILYGSRAKGNYRSGSDIDLAIVGSQFNDGQLVKLETCLDDLLLPYSIDVTRFESIANPGLIEHIRHVAKTPYETPHGRGGKP